jgi:PTS system nitrogen regulatory IIA component
MHFGATLRLLRIEAGLSLRELASRVGVSGTYLSRVENGHDPSPTPDRLIAIADVLGLPRAVLVELARQAGPAVDGYLRRVPEAGALFLEIARRGLRGPQIARIKAFIEAELPGSNAPATAGTRRLADLLPREHVVVGVSCSDLEDLVSVAVTRLGDDVDARVVAQRLLAHEREVPTLLGGGFMVPNAIIEGAAEAMVLLTLTQPLELPSPDHRPVRVAFVLVSGPDGGGSRLDILTRVARLASYDAADELCAATTPEQARSIVERIESLW